MNDLILGLYRPIGSPIVGGMGKVQRVHHTLWDIDLAMKQPHSHMFETESQKETFIHECEAWINLGLHPHIVSCHYVRRVDGIPSIFAEWMDGGSLAAWIKSEKLYAGSEPEVLRRILDIAIQVAWGLDYAHEQGLIHQDVKPDNLLFSSDGDAKVCDFGIAKAKADLAASGSTTAPFEGTMISKAGAYTPAYCAPEQSGGGTVSRRTDIWSWAVSVMEMFVGERLWSSGSVVGSACDTYFESTRVPVPKSVKDLLRECFKANEAERPHDFKIIADGVKSIYQTRTSEEYVREFPEAAKIQGDSLNNRAVSMLDLGRAAEAEKLFDQAMAMDQGHPQATYNHGLLLWRSGRMSDTSLVYALEQSRMNRPNDWKAAHLLGLIHLERQDAKGAVAALSTALSINNEIEVQNALEYARYMESYAPKCLGSFEGHTHAVSAVAFSADGRWALSGSWDATLRLWEVRSGECLRIFEGHTNWVNSVALSADGRLALSGSIDATLRLWEVSSGKCLRILVGHTGSVESLALSADGRWALSGSIDENLHLWEVSSGKCLKTFEGHTHAVIAVAISVDMRWGLSASKDGTLRLWELSSGKCVRICEGLTYGVTSVALSADCRRALSGNDDKTLHLWEVSSGKCLRTFEGHTKSVRSIALSADGRWGLSSGWDETLRLWEMSSGKCLRTFEGHTDSVGSVALSEDCRWALSGGDDKTLRLWDINSLLNGRKTLTNQFVVCQLPGVKESFMIQKRFNALLGAAGRALSDGEYRTAWNLASESRALSGHQFSTEAMDIANHADLHGIRTGLSGAYCLRTFDGHTAAVRSVVLSADGRLALSGSEDKTLRLWDVSSGKCLRIFEGHADFVHSVVLSADGRWALSASSDKAMRLWEVSSGKCLRICEGHTHGVASVALSADEFWGVSGSFDKTLRLWELSSGKCLRTFQGNTSLVSSVALSADVRWALSGSGNGTLRLWEVSSGKSLRTFEGHTSLVYSVSMSADGRWALSGSDDNTMRLWELDWDYEFPDSTDWDTSATPYLVTFLSRHTPYAAEMPPIATPSEEQIQLALTRCGKATWTNQDLQQLMTLLQYAGFGWLRPDGVKRKLEKMAAEWQGPPPPPREQA